MEKELDNLDQSVLEGERIGNTGGTPQKLSLYQKFITGLSVVFFLYMFYATVFGPYKTTIVHRALFLMVTLFLYFTVEKPLKIGKSGKYKPFAKAIDMLIVAGVVVTCGYIVHNFYDVFSLLSANMLKDWQMWLGLVLILIVLETTRRSSPPFAILATIGILYTLYGDRLPGLFNHSGMTLKRMVYLTVFTEEGIFGLGLSVASTYLFMFIIFGAVLQGTGASIYLMDICNGFVGHLDGGAAKTSVTGSALMGTISGSSISNVVTTGSITIPLMKRLGFKPEVAAAVEVTASEGGQLMPPIMGAAAFLMAEMTAIPYTTIAKAAVIPAVLYYFNTYLLVHLEAKKSGIKGLPKKDLPNWKHELKMGWHIIAPIGILLYLMLYKSYTATFSGLFCVTATLVAAQLRPHTRLSVMQICSVITKGVRSVAGLVAILAGLGLVKQAILVTGLGGRLSDIMIQMVGGSRLGIVLVGVVVTILLGCGMTTPAAYTLVAMFIAPSFINMGFPVLATHMFLFFFAIKSGSTPPVAVVAAVAAGIAEADFWKTAFKSTFFGAASFLVAFGYLLNPALLLQGSAPFIILSTITTGIGACAMAAAIQGWAFSGCRGWERFLLFAGACCLIMPEVITDFVGLALVALPLLLSWRRSRYGIATVSK